MALVKKVNPEWSPSENPDLKVGETLDVTDYRTLVITGSAVLVDEDGNEKPLPGQVFSCPVCFYKTDTIDGFTSHVDSHKKVYKSAPVVIEREEVKVEEAPLYVSKKTLAEEAAKKDK